MASEFQIGGTGQLGGFDMGNLAGGASPYPIGTPPSPSMGGGTNFSQNGPTLPAPDLGKPDTQMYGRLQNVLGNPSQLAQDPAYQFLFNQGMQAFNRTQAGKKMTLSGNSALGAENYGQGLAANYFNQMMPQMLAGSQQELQRYQVPGQLGVARYAASHGGTSMGNQSQTGANPGTQGDMGARDLLRQLASQGGQGGGGSYGGGGVPSTRSAPYPSQGGGGGGNYGNPLGPDDISRTGQGGSLDDFMNQLGYGDSAGGFGDWMGQYGSQSGGDMGGNDWQGSVGYMPPGVGGGQGGGGGSGWDTGGNDLGMWSGLDYPIYDYSGGGDGGDG